MNVYIVTKMYHGDDYKCLETNFKIVKVTRDKEKAYELAHNKQLEYMRCYEDVAEENDENKGDSPTYSRNGKDESWEVSYLKLIELFDEILPEPEFTLMASQTRYQVHEHTVE
ncbi:hypothetical protein BGZ94_002873 [Podila epigama]|nr:hypothetical protein BGZ94_002873 [Podila epigama]